MQKISLTIWLSIVVVLAIIGYFLLDSFQNTSRSPEYREALVNIDTAAVSSIHISRAETTLKIQRDPTYQWQIKFAEDKILPADVSVIKGVLDAVLQVKPNRLYAKETSAWASVQLDTSATRLEIYENAKKTLDMLIGKTEFAKTGTYQTYVRLFNEVNTYVTTQSLGYTITADPSAYRRAQILTFNKDSLQSISFEEDSHVLTLSREDSIWHISAHSKKVTHKDMRDKYLARIESLVDDNFVDDFIIPAEPARTIRLSFHNKETILSLYRKDTSYVIRSSVTPEAIFDASYVLENLWKELDFFLSLEKESE